VHVAHRLTARAINVAFLHADNVLESEALPSSEPEAAVGTATNCNVAPRRAPKAWQSRRPHARDFDGRTFSGRRRPTGYVAPNGIDN
jgi:hypothetical protein